MSLESERVLLHRNDINVSDKQKISMFGTMRGDLILTNRRLVFIKTGWGVHVKTYRKVEDFEEGIEKKEHFEIPLLIITGAETGSHMMTSYFSVRYDTPSGPQAKHFFFPQNMPIVIEEWVRAICQAVNEARSATARIQTTVEAEKPADVGSRSLVVVGQTYTGYVGEAMNRVFLEAVKRRGEEVGLREPVILKGKPEDELVKNEHLLPETALLSFLGTNNDKFTQRELEVIEAFVRRGGRLIVTPDPPFSPPNSLAERFGFRFGNPKIEDRHHHEGKHADHIVVTDLVEHPINSGVKSICFGDYGCYPVLAGVEGALMLAFSSGEASPPRTPVAALITHGSGQVLVVGQASLFDAKYLGRDEFSNRRWLENVVAYFIPSSEKT